MNKTNTTFEYLTLICMLYITIDLSSMVFAYKIIEIGPLVAAASSLVFPLTYSIMDIIAEIYGYKTAKKIILFAFVCDFIFATLALSISHIPSTNQFETLAYIQVLGSLLRSTIAQTIGVLIGGFVNIYLISKWKIITKGQYFWLRSIGSSAIGEAVMLVISVVIALAGVLTPPKLFQLIAYTYIYKILFAIIAAPFISLSVIILKNKIGNTQNTDNGFSYMNTLDKPDCVSSFQKS